MNILKSVYWKIEPYKEQLKEAFGDKYVNIYCKVID